MDSRDLRKAPEYSVFVLTHNRRDMLARCIDSILAQDVLPLEVVVFDNASSDGTVEMLGRDYPELRVIRNGENIGCPGGRNAGIARCRGRYVLCVDDDGTLALGSFRSAVNYLERTPVTVLAGVVVDAYHTMRSGMASGPVFTFSGGICVIEREAFLMLGGYHEDGLRQGEETELSYRLYDSKLPVHRDIGLVLDHHVEDTPTRWRLVTKSTARQTILTSLKVVPLPLLGPWLAWKMSVLGVSALRRGYWLSYLQGISSAAALASTAIAARQPASYRAVMASSRWGRARMRAREARRAA